MSSHPVIEKVDAAHANTVDSEVVDTKIADAKIVDANIVNSKIVVSKIDDAKNAEWNAENPIAERTKEREKQQTLRPAIRSSSQTASAARAVVSQPRQMFSQSFVELSGMDRSRRRWTQMSSFLVQSLIVGFLVILPLWFIDMLPAQQLATFLIAPPRRRHRRPLPHLH